MWLRAVGRDLRPFSTPQRDAIMPRLSSCLLQQSYNGMPTSIKEDHPDGLCYTLVNHVASLGCKDIWEMQPLDSATADLEQERAPSLERAPGGERQHFQILHL